LHKNCRSPSFQFRIMADQQNNTNTSSYLLRIFTQKYFLKFFIVNVNKYCGSVNVSSAAAQTAEELRDCKRSRKLSARAGLSLPCSSDPFIVRPHFLSFTRRRRPTQSIARLSFELYASGNSLTSYEISSDIASVIAKNYIQTINVAYG